MQFVIAVKHFKPEYLNTVYNFINAVLNQKKHIKIDMLFFYKDGVYAINNPEFKEKLIKIMATGTNLSKLSVCKASCKRRGINIIEPFKTSSIIEFIDASENTDRIINL